MPGCPGLGCACRTPDGHTAVLLPPRGAGTPAVGHTKAVLLPQAPRATRVPPARQNQSSAPRGIPCPCPVCVGAQSPSGAGWQHPPGPPCLQQAPCPGSEWVSIDPPPASSFYRVRGTELEVSTGFTFHLSTGSSCSSQRINQRDWPSINANEAAAARCAQGAGALLQHRVLRAGGSPQPPPGAVATHWGGHGAGDSPKPCPGAAWWHGAELFPQPSLGSTLVPWAQGAFGRP